MKPHDFAIAALLLALPACDDRHSAAPTSRPAAATWPQGEVMKTRIESGTYFAKHAVLQNIDFSDADLSSAKFDDINMRSATFHNVNLSGTTMDDMNMTNVAITNANLTGMTIDGVKVTDLQAAYAARQKSKGR